MVIIQKRLQGLVGLPSELNNGIIFSWITPKDSARNPSGWRKVNLPIAYTTNHIPVATCGWWGAIIAIEDPSLTYINYYPKDVYSNSGSQPIYFQSCGF